MQRFLRWLHRNFGRPSPLSKIDLLSLGTTLDEAIELYGDPTEAYQDDDLPEAMGFCFRDGLVPKVIAWLWKLCEESRPGLERPGYRGWSLCDRRVTPPWLAARSTATGGTEGGSWFVWHGLGRQSQWHTGGRLKVTQPKILLAEFGKAIVASGHLFLLTSCIRRSP